MREKKSVEKNDIVGICGRIVIPPTLDRTMTGRTCPVIYVDIERRSGIVDRLPVAFEVDHIDPDKFGQVHSAEDYNIRGLEKDFYQGREIMVIGKIRTHRENSRSKINLYIWADWITTAENADTYNSVQLIGKLCKVPYYRMTSKHQPICELILRIEHGHGDVSIVPVMTWNKAARVTADYALAQRLKICGRLQSRVYYKKGQPLTTYEVAAYRVEKLD